MLPVIQPICITGDAFDVAHVLLYKEAITVYFNSSNCTSQIHNRGSIIAVLHLFSLQEGDEIIADSYSGIQHLVSGRYLHLQEDSKSVHCIL